MATNQLALKIVRVCGVPCGNRCSVEYLVGAEERAESGDFVANEKGEAVLNWEITVDVKEEAANSLRLKVKYGLKEIPMCISLEKFIKAETKAKCKFDSKDKSVAVVISGRCAVLPPSFWETLLPGKETATPREVCLALQHHEGFIQSLRSSCGIAPNPRIWKWVHSTIHDTFPESIEKGTFTMSSLINHLKQVLAKEQTDKHPTRRMTIIIQAEDGSAHPLDVMPATFLSEVMEKCYTHLKLDTDNIAFRYNGRLLMDVSHTVEGVGITDGSTLNMCFHLRDVEAVLKKVAALQVEKQTCDYENSSLRSDVEKMRQAVGELQAEVEACREQLTQEEVIEDSVDPDGMTTMNVLLKEVDIERTRHDLAYRSEMLQIDYESKRDELRHRENQNKLLRQHLMYLNESANKQLEPWKEIKEELNCVSEKMEEVDEMLGIEQYEVEVGPDGFIGIELGESPGGSISVLDVDEDSPADLAGVIVGATLYSYDGHSVRSLADLERAMDDFATKQTGTLVIETGAPSKDDYERVLSLHDPQPKPEKSCLVM